MATIAPLLRIVRCCSSCRKARRYIMTYLDIVIDTIGIFYCVLWFLNFLHFSMTHKAKLRQYYILLLLRVMGPYCPKGSQHWIVDKIHAQVQLLPKWLSQHNAQNIQIVDKARLCKFQFTLSKSSFDNSGVLWMLPLPLKLQCRNFIGKAADYSYVNPRSLAQCAFRTHNEFAVVLSETLARIGGEPYVRRLGPRSLHRLQKVTKVLRHTVIYCYE